MLQFDHMFNAKLQYGHVTELHWKVQDHAFTTRPTYPGSCPETSNVAKLRLRQRERNIMRRVAASARRKFLPF